MEIILLKLVNSFAISYGIFVKKEKTEIHTLFRTPGVDVICPEKLPVSSYAKYVEKANVVSRNAPHTSILKHRQAFQCIHFKSSVARPRIKTFVRLRSCYCMLLMLKTCIEFTAYSSGIPHSDGTCFICTAKHWCHDMSCRPRRNTAEK